MASPGELVKAIALATGTPEHTVTTHDRNLVTAGLRTKGGRGTSAAKVTPRDAAHILVALLGSERVQDSVETVLRYSDTVEHNAYFFKRYPEHYPNGRVNVYAPFKMPALDALTEEHSFIDALELLIKLAADDTFDSEFGPEPMSCIIHVRWPETTARITLSPVWRGVDRTHGGAQADYGRYTGYEGGRPAKMPEERRGPIERSASIYSTPIRYIGALLGDRLDKVSLGPKLTGTR